MSRKKKLLIVRTAMGQGGADRVTLNLLKYLDHSKYELTLLLMRNEGEYMALIPANVQVLSTNSGSLWRFLPGLVRSIRSIQADIVFSVDGGTNVPVAIAAFLTPFRKWKIILSERNILFPPGANNLKRRLLVFLKYLFYRFADVLTAVSEGVRDDMGSRLHISASKIRLVNNPMIEPGLFELSKEPCTHPWMNSQEGIPVIVHAGRFVHQKDHATLVRAFKIVNEKSSCRLILLGDGPLKRCIVNLVKTLNLEERIDFPGFDINPFKYFSRCNLFVLSSLHEGLPGVLIQAMACGAPVVSTDCPSGPNEIISQPGVNGILVPVADPNALAQAIVEILSDSKRAKEIAENGLRAVQKFKVSSAIQTYIQAIEA